MEKFYSTQFVKRLQLADLQDLRSQLLGLALACFVSLSLSTSASAQVSLVEDEDIQYFSEPGISTERKGGDSVQKQLLVSLSDVGISNERKGGDSVYKQMWTNLGDVNLSTERKGGDSVYKQLLVDLIDVNLSTERKGGDSVYRSGILFNGLNASGISVTAFPNPTAGAVRVNVQTAGSAVTGTLKVMDLSGKQLNVTSLGEGPSSHLIDLGTYPAGVYLLEAQCGTERVVTRILKQ